MKHNFQFSIFNFQTEERGFTLVETLVTLFIFSIIVLLFGGIFSGSLSSQRRASNIQQVQENADYILEALTKEIRVSTVNTADTPDCAASPAAALNITHPVNGSVVYALAGNNLQRTVNGIQTIVNSNTIQFTRLFFCVAGQAADDKLQPRVTIVTGLKSAGAGAESAMDIQTTVSTRRLSN
ncbi:MAG: prepilin-type N-terminal cleavage/methylation domain-containing protein [Patescibacteria group bacterium]